MGMFSGHKAIISIDGVEIGEVKSVGINLIEKSIDTRDVRENLFRGSAYITPRVTRQVGSLTVTNDKYKEIPKQYF